MLYIVELDFIGYGREPQWNAWYSEHVEVLLSLPGFLTAQRFKCVTAHPSPYLALYTVESAGVLESAPYRSHGGRNSVGEWKPMMTNWHRNLFSGIPQAPAVALDQFLMVSESSSTQGDDCGVSFSWLDNAGLDRTVEKRGLAVASAAEVSRIASKSPRICAYQPLTPQLRAQRP